MKTLLKYLAAILLSATCLSAYAAPDEALTTCISDHSAGAERKALARWVVMALIHHPAIADKVTVDVGQVDASDREMAAIFEHLVLACAPQLRAARQRNPKALEDSFEVLGRLAMAEVMGDPRVDEAIRGYVKYVDLVKVAKAYMEPPAAPAEPIKTPTDKKRMSL